LVVQPEKQDFYIFWLISIVFIGIVYEIGGCIFVMKGLIFFVGADNWYDRYVWKIQCSPNLLSCDTLTGNFLTVYVVFSCGSGVGPSPSLN
jgi:hypothetical protein